MDTGTASRSGAVQSEFVPLLLVRRFHSGPKRSKQAAAPRTVCSSASGVEPNPCPSLPTAEWSGAERRDAHRRRRLASTAACTRCRWRLVLLAPRLRYCSLIESASRYRYGIVRFSRVSPGKGVGWHLLYVTGWANLFVTCGQVGNYKRYSKTSSSCFRVRSKSPICRHFKLFYSPWGTTLAFIN